MSYHRASSPGGRRIVNPARLSDSYYTASAYASPRTSAERVVPISTTTFVTRDAYSGRPRRSTLTDNTRPTTTTSHVAPPPRTRPAVIQSTVDRPTSPSSPHTRSNRSSDYYLNPASSSSHREHSHKKVYSIDGGGKSRLVADIDINNSHGASSNRRHSVDRNGHRPSSSHHRHKAYHLSGPSTKHSKDESEQGYSYTDAAGMYKDTEPRWRHRQGSVEASRPRPTSAVLEQYPARTSARDLGPPTSRALDRFNDGIHRGGSLREPVRDPVRSDGHLPYQEPAYTLDPYLAPSSNRHTAAIHQDRAREPYDDRRSTARELDPHPRSRRSYADPSIPSRGFGVRSDSQDRYGNAMARGSNESIEGRDPYYSDRDYPQPRGDPRIEPRLEPRIDPRMEPRIDPRIDPRSDPRIDPRIEPRIDPRNDLRPEPRSDPRGDPRNDPRSYDYSKDLDRDHRARDKDRLRDDGYGSERDRHHDRDSRRDHDRRDRDRDAGPKDSGDSIANTLLPAAAIGGLGAVAAAAYGSGDKGRDREREREIEERDAKEREREREREREQRDREKQREREISEREKQREREVREREREAEREKREREKEREREREREYEREQRTRERPQDNERERERPRHSSSDSSHDSQDNRDGRDDRRHRRSRHHRVPEEDPSDRERRHASDENLRMTDRERAPPVEFASNQAPIDPDEDYRRRVEQAQREIAGSHENTDSDREQRRVNGADEKSASFGATTVVDPRESATRESRVRIVEPPSDRDDFQPVKGILKRPTQKFPEDPNPIREGVAPLKENNKDGIPPGARWTKIDRRLVNPQALEHAKERFEERLDCVIVLRVLTKEEIQKLADKTKEIRDARYYGDDQEELDRRERRERRRRDRDRDRRERDEYQDDDSEDEYAPRAPRMLEAPSGEQEPAADFVRDRERRRDRDRDREREPVYASGGLGQSA